MTSCAGIMMSSIIPSLSTLNIYRRGSWQPCIEMILLPILHNAANPPLLQILRIDGKGMINNVIMTMAHDVICGKKARKRCCWYCIIWPHWLTSHQSNYCLYYNGIWHIRVCEDSFGVNSKIAQITQSLSKNFICQKVNSTRNGKPRWLSGRFQSLIWRPGETVQNLESPGLSGRVDNPDYICLHTPLMMLKNAECKTAVHSQFVIYDHPPYQMKGWSRFCLMGA